MQLHPDPLSILAGRRPPAELLSLTSSADPRERCIYVSSGRIVRPETTRAAVLASMLYNGTGLPRVTASGTLDAALRPLAAGIVAGSSVASFPVPLGVGRRGNVSPRTRGIKCDGK